MRLVPLRRAALYATSRVVMGNAAVVTSGATGAAARASSSAAARGCLTSGSPSVRWVAKGRGEGGNHVSLRTRQRLQQQQQQQRCATTMTSAVPTSMMSSRAPALTSTKLRTHTCGELRSDAAGSEVMLCGWVSQIRKFGGGLTFVTLRDTYGTVQLTIGEGDAEGLQALRQASTESVVKVVGTVRERDAKAVNADMATGSIEVVVAGAEILNAAATLPFPLSSKAGEANHNLRHKFRYLDLRREQLQHAIRLRSKLALATRSFLAADRGFVEVETPTLFKRTPGGAAEFPVPTQTPGQFYTLVQSPQQFKQLLMVGGYDRYFQLARCYRDEGGRGDRQPEFTQIDIEMSFAAQSDIEDTIAALVQTLWKEGLGVDVKLPFPRMAYADAMRDYGVDKPDTRFGMLLHNLTPCFDASATKSQIISSALASEGGAVLGLKLDGAGDIFDKKAVNKLQEHVRGIGAAGVITVHVQDDGSWAGFISKHVTNEEVAAVNKAFDASPGDVLVLAAGEHDHMQGMLGILRLYCADVLEDNGVVNLRDPSEFNFLWVDDFPLFEPPEDDSIDSSGALESTHHVFTAPKPGDEHFLYTDPTKVRGQHFDLVLNGIELGGGSVRNHQPDVQQYIIEDVLQKDIGHFSHLIEALGYGAPPHGGIALGFDRLMMVMTNSESLRDVIAFPKSFAGKDLMGGAPDTLTPEYLEVYHIKPVVGGGSSE